MDEFEGHWITTYTGKKFHYLDPRPEDIDILDIAHALSLTCRFGGQCRTFYSVAEHSVRVMRILAPEYKLMGLLHDAEEAYVGDLPRPIKVDLGGSFTNIEYSVRSAILEKFGIRTYDFYIAHKEIKKADNVLLATEARDLMPNTDDWAGLPEPLEEIIAPWIPKEAEEIFLNRFRSLVGPGVMP